MKKLFYPLGAVTLTAVLLLIVNLQSGATEDLDRYGQDVFGRMDFLLFFGFFGGEIFLATVSIAAILFLWFRRNNYVGMIIILLAVAGGNVLNKLIKTATERPRPGDQLAEAGYSFPSGHAMVSIIAAVVIIYLLTEKSGQTAVQIMLFSGALLLSALAGLSRLPDQAHYFSDVVGGWLLGYTYAVICLLIYEVIMKRRTVKKTM
ncbi:phosphatase PAP2 family protein [Jeotgalibacillus sp. R-1-5s-1]|uniref:phosphatase PAP2 family protein n=1 Tax=Jeotgalibacillus sp. R-1-5s-1 TaxID=2555897 RepID=UPI001069857F|nr:phosphatase PAP2 family protein [Jeotgalibacillus sp. R-1-5s-1]TFD97655.1 phosphatase PAP2 family protein [Jeotgalibacillus sp. R-1-5s-1]